jgi:hypothetical protein
LQQERFSPDEETRKTDRSNPRKFKILYIIGL